MICSTLGFIIVSEKETVVGRIDVAIEFPHVIYILEFKYSEEDKDESQTALKQIKTNIMTNLIISEQLK